MFIFGVPEKKREQTFKHFDINQLMSLCVCIHMHAFIRTAASSKYQSSSPQHYERESIYIGPHAFAFAENRVKSTKPLNKQFSP